MNRYVVECRSEVSGRKLHGYAAVFGPVAEVPGGWESFAPGAFDDALTRDDVVALFNHDPAQLLGRMSSGTLRMKTDSQGLEFEVDLPDTPAGNTVRELVGRGDLKGASIGFKPGAVERSVAKDGRRHQTHTNIKWLRDVSPVTLPAYEGTDVTLRSFEEVPNDWRQYRTRLLRARMALRTGR